jgi:hypothetical protein
MSELGSARRGELFFIATVGYVKVGRDKIDPDLRVREAIRLVFTRFLPTSE